VLFNSQERPPYVPHFFHNDPTPTPVSSKEVFFHQRQEWEEGICGICAINNALGTEVTNPQDLTAFNVDYYGQKGLLVSTELSGGYRKGTLADAADGNDALGIQAYLVDLARQGKIDPKYEQTTYFPCKGIGDIDAIKQLEQKIDTMIVGREGGTSFAHLVAFRKTQEGQWRMLDSLNPFQENLSPSEYITQRLKHKWNLSCSCIYVPPQ
jgi:hypothetical protein